jgi:hypothetical protein
MNDVPGFRPIVQDDGKRSHWEIFEGFVNKKDSEVPHTTSLVPMDYEKAPITVHHKQFEVINFRRCVRYEIEKSRAISGRPINGRRAFSYKYVTKHIQAQRRLRNPNGSFSLVKLEEEHVHSIADV